MTSQKRFLSASPNCRKFLPTEIGSIVSAACLAHDLGNPPFGHSGERAISTFFSEGKGQFLGQEKQSHGEQLSSTEREDLTHFEGNANAFRLLTHQFEGRRERRICHDLHDISFHCEIPFFIQSLQVRNQNSASLSAKKRVFTELLRNWGLLCSTNTR